MARKPVDKKTKIVFALFFICFAVLQIYKFHWSTADLRVGEEIVTVQVAKTLYQQNKGLGGRETIGKHEGMLFPFDTTARHAIVMRDMEFSIDIVWLMNGKVVDMAPSVPIEPGAKEGELRRYYPRAEANAVLELPAGKAAEYGLSIGDTIEQI